MPVRQDEVVPRRDGIDALGEPVERDARALAAQSAQLARRVVRCGVRARAPTASIADALRRKCCASSSTVGVEAADRRAPQSSRASAGDGKRDRAVERDARRRAAAPLADDADDRRVQLVEQRGDRRLGAAFRLDRPARRTTGASRGRRAARASARSGPGGGSAAARTTSTRRPSAARERLRDAEPRVDVLAVDPEDRRASREPSAVCASSAASRRCDGASTDAPSRRRTMPCRRSSRVSMPLIACRTRSSIRSGRLASVGPAPGSTSACRRSGDDGASASQCASGRAASARPNVGRCSPPCSARDERRDLAVELHRRGEQQQLPLERRQREQHRERG